MPLNSSRNSGGPTTLPYEVGQTIVMSERNRTISVIRTLGRANDNLFV
jgi:hypothetical protein